jgi:hypothetical protein
MRSAPSPFPFSRSTSLPPYDPVLAKYADFGQAAAAGVSRPSSVLSCTSRRPSREPSASLAHLVGSLGRSLLHIVDFLPNVEFSDHDQRTVKTRSEVEMEVKLMAKEVSALASCNRALRRQLLPIAADTFAIGSLGNYKAVLTKSEKLASLASKGDEMLACVRSVPSCRRLAPTHGSPVHTGDATSTETSS